MNTGSFPAEKSAHDRSFLIAARHQSGWACPPCPASAGPPSRRARAGGLHRSPAAVAAGMEPLDGYLSSTGRVCSRCRSRVSGSSCWFPGFNSPRSKLWALRAEIPHRIGGDLLAEPLGSCGIAPFLDPQWLRGWHRAAPDRHRWHGLSRRSPSQTTGSTDSPGQCIVPRRNEFQRWSPQRLVIADKVVEAPGHIRLCRHPIGQRDLKAHHILLGQQQPKA